MPQAVIRGGTGQIGRAVAAHLAKHRWQVRITSRSLPPPDLPCEHVRTDPDDPEGLSRAVGPGADLLLDCAGFNDRDADRLLTVANKIGRIVVISSASVYRDAEGRTLDEAAETGFPRFEGPLTEDHPTVAPGPETYSTRKIAMEHRLLGHAACRVTILRPCAIHGPHSRHAREWWMVKRLLDGRAHIPLAHGGESVFQTSSTEAIARAVMAATAGVCRDVVNVIDGDSPSVAEIARAIMAVTGRSAELVPLPGPPGVEGVGKTPWSAVYPMICASSLAPARPYAQTLPEAVTWLLKTVPPENWQRHLPQLAAYPRNHFDYAAEDRLLSGLRA